MNCVGCVLCCYPKPQAPHRFPSSSPPSSRRLLRAPPAPTLTAPSRLPGLSPCYLSSYLCEPPPGSPARFILRAAAALAGRLKPTCPCASSAPTFTALPLPPRLGLCHLSAICEEPPPGSRACTRSTRRSSRSVLPLRLLSLRVCAAVPCVTAPVSHPVPTCLDLGPCSTPAASPVITACSLPLRLHLRHPSA